MTFTHSASKTRSCGASAFCSTTSPSAGGRKSRCARASNGSGPGLTQRASRGVMKEGPSGRRDPLVHRDTASSSASPRNRVRWWAIVHPDDLPKRGERVAALEQGEPDVLEYRISPRNGRGRSETPLDSPGRGTDRLGGAILGTTERRKAEEERDRLLAREWVARAQAEERHASRASCTIALLTT